MLYRAANKADKFICMRGCQVDPLQFSSWAPLVSDSSEGAL